MGKTRDMEKAILEYPRYDGVSAYERKAKETLTGQIVGAPPSDYMLLRVLKGDFKTERHPQGGNVRRLTNTVLEVLATGPLVNSNPDDIKVNVGDWVQIRDNAMVMQHAWLGEENIIIRRHDTLWNFGKISPYAMFKEKVKDAYDSIKNSDHKQETTVRELNPSS